MERDMTVGSPSKIIWNFTVPIFIGNIFQQFYSMVDTVIVGKFVGTKALAAVGSTGTINFLILGFLMGMTAGFTVLTSQRFWRRGHGWNAENSGFRCDFVSGSIHSHDGGEYGFYETADDIDAYA